MLTDSVTADEYGDAFRTLVKVAESDASDLTTEGVRQVLMSLLWESGYDVQLGVLLNNADSVNTRTIITLLAGWQRFGWPDVDGVSSSDDFLRKMIARNMAKLDARSPDFPKPSDFDEY